MKSKFVFLFSICLLVVLSDVTISKIWAYSFSPIYARATNNVYLYSKPIDNEDYKLFLVPNSYFVKLTGNAGDTTDLFYSAIYLDITGYVKKGEVVPVQGTPIKPFASELNFRVFVPGGTELRKSPNAESPFNIVVNLSFLENNLIYYGTIQGEEMISRRGNTWYYCKFSDNINNYYGYVYSSLCDLLPVIYTNSEDLPLYDKDLFLNTEIEETAVNVAPNFSNVVKTIIIVAITLPCFLLIYLLFKPTNLVVDNGKKGKTKVKRLKKSEYYELED